MFSTVMLLVPPVFSLSISNLTNIQKQSIANISQPGPEDIECFNAEGSQIDWYICQPAFHLLENDIQHHPGPQIWHGTDVVWWGSQASVCYIAVGPEEEEGGTPQQSFSLALVKRLALTILNYCSSEVEGHGIGGNITIAPGFVVEISGVFLNGLEVAEDVSFKGAVHQLYIID